MLWLFAAAALAGECEEIGFSDIVAIPPPAVIVLGERHGTQPDLARAGRIVRRLAQDAPVTVALESVHERYQRVLDDYADGAVDEDDLPGLLEWDTSWGFPFQAYAPLIRAADGGAEVIAAGLDLGPPPLGKVFPIPQGYGPILRDAMGEHPVADGMEERFVTSMAWRDRRIAELATKDWNGAGYLVVVAGRGHVEGGRGVQWQASKLVQAPVHAFVLAWAAPPCYAGDRVWRPNLLERLFSGG